MAYQEIKQAFIAFIITCITLIALSSLSGCGPDKEKCGHEFTLCMQEGWERCETLNGATVGYYQCDANTYRIFTKECEHRRRVCMGILTYD